MCEEHQCSQGRAKGKAVSPVQMSKREKDNATKKSMQVGKKKKKNWKTAWFREKKEARECPGRRKSRSIITGREGKQFIEYASRLVSQRSRVHTESLALEKGRGKKKGRSEGHVC